MFHAFSFILTTLVLALRAFGKSKGELMLENLALRQQLASMHRTTRRPIIYNHERFFWIALRRSWTGWKDSLIFVKPDTVVAWHRKAFRLYWRHISRPKGRPPIDPQIRTLIARMATENAGWRAPRIHGELLKLGFSVSERTVSRYLRSFRTRPNTGANWKTFLENHRHQIAATDFFTVPTATFKNIYVLFIIDHFRRRILHFAVTKNPTADWVIQQMREAFPCDSAPRYLIMDNDSTFSDAVTESLESFGVTTKRTSFRSPWQNGVAERWVGICRRELLDHVIVLGERQLTRLLESYIAYYHDDRCHLALDKDTPAKRPVDHQSDSKCEVVSLPRVGGLHHRYAWRDAA
ncbi:MAG: putative transposase [Candidatus Binatia bacterium]|jgi:putative transposase